MRVLSPCLYYLRLGLGEVSHDCCHVNPELELAAKFEESRPIRHSNHYQYNLSHLTD